jgi:hypothetical protein
MNLIGPIEMSDFESSILELQGALMFVAYFILVTGLILRIMRISDTGGDMVAMTKAVFVGFFLVMLIATARYWFEGMDRGMNDAAEVINDNFGSEPFAVADALVETINENPEADGWGVDKIVNSIYLSIIYGISKLGITLAAVFQVPFYILQYVLKWLGFLFLPIGLALFIFPSLSSIGVKLIANLLAVMAWPIGFAITNLAAMSFVNDFATASTFTGNDSGTALYMMSFGSLIMGLIAALILVIGTLATPTIMFMIFSSGAGLQGLTGAATSAAAFTTYLAGSLGGRGAAAAAPSAPAPAPAREPAGAASYHVNEPSAAYGSSETALAPVLSRYTPSPSGGGGQPALPGGDYPALPGPPSPSNPLLPISPHDPSGSQRAAMLFARGTTPKPIINI